ncbi:hypothetical protein VTL71DRAFT_11282 [Oculimacula yallundae]|uniref:Major facilitator superfamily (MFS) profile domain-containing protein n=1 Tax=Oculimacula yallundae TaxID=86028 RepID=A0ABR4CQ36_9HELO
MAMLNKDDPVTMAIPIENVESASKDASLQPDSQDSTVSRAREKRLVLKIDLFILPLLAMVYFFAAMGRSDLANASVAGMTEELELSPQDYSNAANMFLVGYIFFQLPGTLLVRKIGPPRQFAAAMVTWGVVTALTVKVQTSAQLLAMRFLVGMAEAFIQGAVFYLSFFYTYREMASRGAIFYSMATLAGAFNGIIAYAITKDLNGVGGWLAWRWIFLVEGILPIGTSVFVWLLLPASPKEARIGFSEADRNLAVARSQSAHNNLEEKLNIKQIHKPLLSLKFWGFIVISCCGHFATGSFSNFLPLIVKGFGYSTLDTQLFTVIVYACAFVGLLSFGFIADKTNKRGLTLAVANSFTILGYTLLVALKSRQGQFAATCITAFGAFPAIILQMSWMVMNVVGYTNRGASLAYSNIFSQMFSICGNQVYTNHRVGNIAALGLTVLSLVTALSLSWYLRFQNSQKQAQRSDLPEIETVKMNDLSQGVKHPDFFYTP